MLPKGNELRCVSVSHLTARFYISSTIDRTVLILFFWINSQEFSEHLRSGAPVQKMETCTKGVCRL